MKQITRSLLMALAMVVAITISDPLASARKKDVLDGTQVNLGKRSAKRASKDTPIEERLRAAHAPGLYLPPTKTVYLYPKGQNVDQGIVEDGVQVTLGPLVSTGVTDPETISGAGSITNVSDSARIDIYLPEKPNGQMVVYSFGGGYGFLSVWTGMYTAKWLNDNGIACATVKYRLPHGHHEVPLRDLQNAIRYCRYHSEEWGVNQIGVMGTSAGGHLSASAQTMYVDSLTRPDFAVLLYPVISMEDEITHQGTKVNLLGDQKDDPELVRSFTLENNVNESTSPTFIALSADDALVPAENSLRYYQALIRNKVPAEMHIFPFGGHGFGFNDPAIGLDMSIVKDKLGCCRPELTAELGRWLSQIGGREFDIPQTDQASYAREPDCTVRLYPEGQNVDKGIEENGVQVTLGPGESTGSTREEVFGKDNNLRYVGDSARFDLYLAKNPNGKMVIICPGGAYWYTAVVHEGEYAAQWLNSLGISAAVVKYRIPFGHCTAPLTDVQNTMRYCRAHSSEWGIDKIGVMGFSAGGHLAASAANLYIDSVTKPDFSVLVYPVISSEPGVTHQDSMNNLVGKGAATELLEKYSMDKHVGPETPETFIIFSSDDYGVPPENEIRYFRSLLANGVKCEMHAIPGGVHGYGFSNIGYAKDPIREYRRDFLAAMQRFLSGIK